MYIFSHISAVGLSLFTGEREVGTIDRVGLWLAVMWWKAGFNMVKAACEIVIYLFLKN